MQLGRVNRSEMDRAAVLLSAVCIVRAPDHGLIFVCSLPRRLPWITYLINDDFH